MKHTEIKRVVVAVKPWQRGLPLATRHAHELVERVGGEMLLAGTVYDARVAAGLERADTAAMTAQARLIEGARVDLERLAQSLRDWGMTVRTRVLWDTPAYRGILRAARDWRADVLVVGVTEQRPLLSTRLTDTDWQLMRLCTCPLLLVKNPAFDGYRTVLAAVDPLHAHAEPAGLDQAVLATGAGFARAFGSQLRVVHASPDPATFELASAVEVSPGVLYGDENVESLHRRAVEELVEQYGVRFDAADVRPGDPAEVIAAVAAERRAELVVVGALQRGRLEQAVLGSTAEAVAAELECDVLVVPGPTGLRAAAGAGKDLRDTG